MIIPEFTEPWQVNIYAAYHNLNIRALTNEDDSPKTVEVHGERVCLYAFLWDDDSTSRFIEMPFDKFVSWVKENGFERFDYYRDESFQWVWHLDAYPSFTKKGLDAFLSSLKSLKTRGEYLFLKQ